MDELSIATIVGSFGQIIAIFGVIFFVKKKFGKNKLKKYQTDRTMPTGAITCTTAKIGTPTVYKNVVKVAERDRTLFIKMPFTKVLAIPFSDFKTSFAMNKKKDVMINFTWNEPGAYPIIINIPKEKHIEFPELIQFSQQKLEEKQARDKKYAKQLDPKKTLAPQIKTLQDTIREANKVPTNTVAFDLVQAKNRVNNWVRGGILIMVVIGTIVTIVSNI